MKTRTSNRSLFRGRQPRKQDDSFYVAGLRLLAHSDFEEVSIAKIARDAKGSVGAFYYQYPDKVTFLEDIIWKTFRRLEISLDRRLSRESPRIVGGIRFLEFIADIAGDLSRPEVAGVIRAALKLGSTDEKALRPYEAYRARVGDWAAAMFTTGKKDGALEKRIRDGMQILFALIEDAILAPNSAPARIADKKLSEIISDSILAYTGVSRTLRVSPKATQTLKNRELKDEFTAKETTPPKFVPAWPKQKQIVKSTRRKVKSL